MRLEAEMANRMTNAQVAIRAAQDHRTGEIVGALLNAAQEQDTLPAVLAAMKEAIRQLPQGDLTDSGCGLFTAMNLWLSIKGLDR